MDSRAARRRRHRPTCRWLVSGVKVRVAALAGATELGGGLLTAAGAADPAGPLAIMGAMTVASVTHRASGPLAANRGSSCR